MTVVPWPPVPDDVAAWAAVWEAWLHDQANDELAAFAGQLLLEVLADRGVKPGRPRFLPPS